MVVTDSVVFGKNAEVETMEVGAAVPLLPSSDVEGTKAVPLGLETEPLLPSSEEEGTNADDAPVPVGPTTTELMLDVGKGAP